MKVFILTVVCAVAGCAQIQLSPAAPQAPAQAAAMDPKTVIATVAGISVTLEDFRKMLENAPPQMLQAVRNDPRSFLQQMFLFRYLTSEGDKLNLADKSPLKEQLQTQRDWVVANAMVSEEQNNFTVTAEMIDTFYKQNQSRWQQSKIKVILVGFKPSSAGAGTSAADVRKAAEDAFNSAHPLNERSEDEAKKLAADLVSQLRNGADFGALVKKYSDDPTSKDSGGEFGTVKANGPYSEDVKKAVLPLNAGQITDPIRQPNGYYIIKVDERNVQPLNEVRENIVQELRQTHRDAWLKDLMSRFNPSVQKNEFFMQPERYLGPVPAPPKP